jgi:hypothetical protein
MSDPDERKPPISDPAVLRRMAIAFDLFEVAEQMMRQNLRRRNPAASDEEIERGVREWLHKRPGAEIGDGVGHPVALPRERR